MRRNKIAAIILAAAALAVSACSNPVAPSAPKRDNCSVTTGGMICMK
ncbi:MAG: hypothetical protein HOQ09_02960 [Gemmatimonadaceae bacterium]|nr:hypothetical protein [Gemmatimonadaceae bacterium]